MTETETTLVVLKVKAYWQEQVVDMPTVKAWHEALGALDFDDTIAAIALRVEAGFERPSCAALYRDARRFQERRIENERIRRKPIEHRLSESERAAGKRALHEIVESLLWRTSARCEAAVKDSQMTVEETLGQTIIRVLDDGGFARDVEPNRRRG
jgi:hypothetical protein